MHAQVDRERVKNLREQGAVLVEVLPEEEYEGEHLTGAVNIPLKKLDRTATARFKKDAPIVVYCHDYL